MSRSSDIEEVLKQSRLDLSAGKKADAEKRMVAALSGGANNVQLLVALADFYRVEGKYLKSKQLYEKSHILDPASDYILVNLGIVYRQLGNHEQAKNAFSLAVQRNRKNAEALNNCGSSHSVLGDLESAKHYFEQALEANPNYTKPLLNIGGLVQYAEGDTYSQRLISYLERMDELPENSQIDLHFALGKCFEDHGQYLTSMDHYLKGNALKSKSLDYSVQTVLEKMKAREEIMAPGPWTKEENLGCNSDVPIFVLGMPRSGTSLVEQILASHSQVYGAGELTVLDRSLVGLKLHNGIVPEATDQRILCQKDFTARGEFYVEQVKSLAPQAKRIVDKLPMNFVHIGLIHLLLPNAKIVHCRRHPIDTCLSNFKISFGEKMEWTYDLDSLGAYYLGYDKMMTHWEKILPGKFLTIDYEDVVSDLETQAKRLISHCDLEWEEACLQFHKTERSVHTASVAQVRRKIYSSSVGKWEKYGKTIQPLMDKLKPLLEN
ncbi:MAG: sulfotransferase [Sneathiellales bacterium]|nr:sulfotransferase [Sneathiellales bacterium]